MKGPAGAEPELPFEFDPAVLESETHVCYGLTADLRLSYLNSGWFAFADQNGGEPEISEFFGVGASIADAISGPLRDYYVEIYRNAIASGDVWQQVYECSSADTRRLFHQTVYPLRNGTGLLVVNSLVESGSMRTAGREAAAPMRENYSGRDGLITQCSHCRRAQRTDRPQRWDWVPEWVRRMPKETTHGLCPVCYDYYYRQPFAAPATRPPR